MEAPVRGDASRGFLFLRRPTCARPRTQSGDCRSRERQAGMLRLLLVLLDAEVPVEEPEGDELKPPICSRSCCSVAKADCALERLPDCSACASELRAVLICCCSSPPNPPPAPPQC
jgi:hypothetical protein